MGVTTPIGCSFATTATMTGLVTNAEQGRRQPVGGIGQAAGYDWWMRCTSQEHFETLNTVTGVLVGTGGDSYLPFRKRSTPG
jgi:hypothetical protein